MKRLVSTLNLPKKEWLLYRKQGITGTDAGAICGMNPYKSAFAVYQDKISDDIEEYDNEAMRQGRDLEEYVASRFEEATGLKVRRANAIFQNEEYPFMLADFDRLVVGASNGEKVGLECKTVSPFSSDKWKEGAIPLHYQMQVQHYLAVSGFDSWYLAALIFGKELIIHKIERDEEMISALMKIEERFWKENVLARVMPDPDGSKACAEQIAKLYSNSDKEKTIELLGVDDALKRREELINLIDKLEKEKMGIDQTIQLQLKDASYGMAGEYKVSWVSAVSKRLDTKRLKAEKPDVYDEYSKESSSRRFIVKHAA